MSSLKNISLDNITVEVMWSLIMLTFSLCALFDNNRLGFLKAAHKKSFRLMLLFAYCNQFLSVPKWSHYAASTVVCKILFYLMKQTENVSLQESLKMHSNYFVFN